MSKSIGKAMVGAMIAVSLVEAGPGWAKTTKPIGRSVMEQGETIRISAIYGEKSSEFKVTTKDGISYLTFVSNQDGEKKRVLSSKDVAYLLQKLRQVPTKMESREACSRQWTYVKYRLQNGSEQEASGCLGGSTKTAQNLTSVLNLLSTLLYH